MFVALHRKRLGATLVKMPLAGRTAVSIVALRVRQFEPLAESAHLAIDLRATDKVPMIRQDAVSEKLQFHSL